MISHRRDFMKMAGAGLGKAAAAPLGLAHKPSKAVSTKGEINGIYDVKTFGAIGDGRTIATTSINRAIEAASTAGGGTVRFSAGVYACYSIHLRSNVTLFIDQGATILAANVVEGDTTTHGYDAAEINEPWDKYQDYGHSHWRNSLIWGESIHDFAILGPGLIWGKGLSRGASESPLAETPRMGNKTIGLKNCRNVLMRDFSILEGGHFGVLATGVDNLVIDNIKIDTNRDGIDIDCCRNVRVTRCSINSPWDDAICPKSSFALGYARATENVTISDCYVTGAYEMGTMLDGTWKRLPPGKPAQYNGSIKLGTESNGGFKNIAITNCVFDGSKGFALESSDGAIVEDITFTSITMRDCTNTPIFLRLGRRMRGPAGIPVGSMKRVILSDIISSNSISRFGGGGMICGILNHPITDIKLSNIYVEHVGGGTREMALVNPAELAEDDPYPDHDMFGDLPTSGFFLRNIVNIDFTNVEVAFTRPDVRPVFWLDHVDGVDFSRIKIPKMRSAPVFALHDVRDFHISSSRNLTDIELKGVVQRQI